MSRVAAAPGFPREVGGDRPYCLTIVGPPVASAGASLRGTARASRPLP